MNPNKTTVLRFKPIDEITEEEMKDEVLATDSDGSWLQGIVLINARNNTFYCDDNAGLKLRNIKLYAVLPKDE